MRTHRHTLYTENTHRQTARVYSRQMTQHSSHPRVKRALRWSETVVSVSEHIVHLLKLIRGVLWRPWFPRLVLCICIRLRILKEGVLSGFGPIMALHTILPKVSKPDTVPKPLMRNQEKLWLKCKRNY